MPGIRLLAIPAGVLLVLLTGCSALAPWETNDSHKEVPYAHGRLVESKYKVVRCMMCPTGSKSETAYFSGFRKYSIEEIGKKAEALLAVTEHTDGWIKADETYDGRDRYFSPVRIFLVSIDPIVVVTFPWTYRAFSEKKPNWHAVSEEGHAFHEIERGRNRYFPQYHASHLRMPVEIRTTLPAGTTRARVITIDRDTVVAIGPHGASATAVDLGAYRLLFTRADDGKVLTSFERSGKP